jgi:short chain dehydrogenase
LPYSYSSNNTWRIGGGDGDGDGGTATTMVKISAISTGSISTGSGTGVTPVPLLGPGPGPGPGPRLILGRQVQARRAISSCAVLQHNDKGPKHTEASSGGQGLRVPVQSQSPLGHIGVAAALAAAPAAAKAAAPTLWDEFALRDRVALVSGANRGLGLEMALVLIEAGARAVYCVDLPAQPGDEWVAVAEYVKRMCSGTGADGGGGGRLEYVSGDVRDQKTMWRIGEEIGDREGRMDVCVAAAGILRSHTDCLEYPADEFEEVRYCFLFFSPLGAMWISGK